MAVKGVGASFKISDTASPTNLTDVSAYCNKINATSDVARLDATTFQPNVAAPLKTEVAGFRTRGITLTVVHTQAAYTFFSGIEGSEGLDFEYGPEGTAVGETKITGKCNVLSVPMPQADVQGLETFDVQLNVTSLDAVGTY